jgi:hypothetical protein
MCTGSELDDAGFVRLQRRVGQERRYGTIAVPVAGLALRGLRESLGETIREGETPSRLVGGVLDVGRARDARLHAAYVDRVAEAFPVDVVWTRVNRLLAIAAGDGGCEHKKEGYPDLRSHHRIVSLPNVRAFSGEAPSRRSILPGRSESQDLQIFRGERRGLRPLQRLG